MTSRLRNTVIIVATTALAGGGIAAVATHRSVAPTADLTQIRALARAGQFPQAQSLLDRLLQEDPKNQRAHLLMAQLTTEPTNAQPEIALEHLGTMALTTPERNARIKFLEGKARYQQGRYDLAEDCWAEALRLDPIVPEAGWTLIELLDKEGRQEEAHRLGMRMHELEPDPRDRVRVLLEMSRLDIEAPEFHSQVVLFEPLVKQHPEHLPLTLTLGQALVHHNRSDEGIELLRNAVAHHPDSPEAWDAWLKSLALTPEVELLASEFRRLPHALASDPRFAKHEGMVAHYSQDLAAALRAYRRAFAFEPYNQGVIYRFRAVLAQAGETAEFERVNQYYSTFKDAFMQLRGNYFESPDRAEDPAIHEKDFKQSRGAYFEVRAIKTLGVEPHPRIYQRLADLREKMGRADEARAWHRQVLRDDPEDAVSLAALKRLK